ncbi:hypothetical protein ACHAWF_004301 [Thalassiosira exigua]
MAEEGPIHHGSSGVVFRSATGTKRLSGTLVDGAPDAGDAKARADEGAVLLHGADGGDDDERRHGHEVITLPQSTHSLLFTEDVFTPPFAFAALVVFVSIGCLSLALWDNLSGGTLDNPLNVPSNVHPAVRSAQYLSVLVALTMEEEIPTGTHLLRQMPRDVVENKLQMSYAKFVMSSMIRLAIGYMFLFNTFLVIVQSDRVLDMFYDLLALNFIALMDDIAFHLAKFDILGKRLRIAAGSKCFQMEFEKRPYILRKKITIFVKVVYLFNLILFIAGIGIISAQQNQGRFQCGSIAVVFGEDIWERAWVKSSRNESYNKILMYSHFNGIYKQVEETHARRPRYREVRKSDGEPYATKIGAELKYCPDEGAWVFTHEMMSKTNDSEHHRSGCHNWLLRSPDTEAYDLMDVQGEWSIWVGRIEQGVDFTLRCNECKTDMDCNMNGVCEDKKVNVAINPGIMGIVVILRDHAHSC